MSLPIFPLPQLSIVRDAAGPRLVGRTLGIAFEIEEAALKMVADYGSTERAALFVVRMGFGTIVARTAALTPEGSVSAFRITILNHPIRESVNSLKLAEALAADGAKGDLQLFEWHSPVSIPRPVEAVRTILKSGDSPLLLGTAQALLDGCKIAVTLSDGGPNFVRDVWQLLPHRSRSELHPATFAPSAALGFDVVQLPEGTPHPKGYLTAEQVRDYPEGRYELALQRAAEAGDQAELDRLFARKTSGQVLWMVAGMIAFAFASIALLKFF